MLFPALALGLITALACSDSSTAPSREQPGGPEEGQVAAPAEVMTVTAGPDGSASIDLPEHLGTPDAPPTLVCSYTPDGEKWWVAFGETGCRLESTGSETMRVTIDGLTEGWLVRIEVHPTA